MQKLFALAITVRVKFALVEQDCLVNCRHVGCAIRLGEDKGQDHGDLKNGLVKTRHE